MAPHKIVTINGRTYDAVTGLLVDTPKKVRPTQPAASVHATTQRSTTLNRRFTKKPTVTPKVTPTRRSAGQHMDIAKSSTISRFAPHPAPVTTRASAPRMDIAKITPDTPARKHPTVVRALARQQLRKAAVIQKPVVTAKEAKEASIEKALTTPKPKVKKIDTRPWYQRARVLVSIVIIVVIVFGILYSVYRFVPSISVSYAAMQANISASYPEYTPDGYALHQPVSYSDGQIILVFVSNSNASEQYTITQKRSSWDSTAVLDTVVRPKAGENYATTKERGLTIYTYQNNAYWVNGGILYSIEGSAALSGDQIRRIATSL